MVKLVTEYPELWPELLRRCLGIELPDDVEVLQGPETVRQLHAADHTADGTMVVKRVCDGAPVEALVNEIQCKRDDDKWWTWPLHLAGIRARLKCPTTLVVLTPYQSTARWAARPIDVGRGRMTLRPLVIGPAQIPCTMDLDDARQHPALATMAVMVHGRRPGSRSLSKIALRAVHERLEEQREGSTLLLDLITASVGAKALEEMEEEMEIGTNVSFTKIGRQKFAEGHALGRKEGREKGREEGREKGREEGRRDARRQAILLVLQSRGLVITQAQRRRLERCPDDEQLESWLRQALVVERTGDLFGTPRRSRSGHRTRSPSPARASRARSR
ncbi:hypothetical protein [Paraliomyxa miuraensis]|uniref:hypothetical protein n=1 Tax=Paraliomyxa miuraensis TaxID=376150 RepID=UPI0022552F97|nr:hypothetical protein [Paraliomyxa miuraensis]MCX4247441.1 hypothetical protein [Paraliomyxa miuraensis]